MSKKIRMESMTVYNLGQEEPPAPDLSNWREHYSVDTEPTNNPWREGHREHSLPQSVEAGSFDSHDEQVNMKFNEFT